MRAEAPQLNIYEKITQATSDLDIRTACLVPANTGYGNIPAIMQTPDELVKYFGQPTSLNRKFWFQAYNYLQYENDGIWVMRPLKTTDLNYSIKITGSTITNDNANSNLYNYDLATNLIFNTTITDSLEAFNRFVENEDKTAVVVCSSEDYWNNPITDETMTILRDLDVYIHQTISSSLNNKYTIALDEHIVTADNVYNNAGDTDNYIVIDGNQTHMSLGDYVRCEDSSKEMKTITGDTVHIDGIEYNGVRVESMLAVVAMNFGSGGIYEPQYGDIVVGSTSGATGIVYKATAGTGSWAGGDANGSIEIHSITGTFVSFENLLIDDEDCATISTFISDEYQLILSGNHQYLNIDDVVSFNDDGIDYTITGVTYDDTLHDTIITIDYTYTSINDITSDDTMLIESDTTLIILDSTLSDTSFTLKYLGSDWNDQDCTLGGTTNTVLENAEDGDVCEYNSSTAKWELNSTVLVDNAYYFIKEDGVVYIHLSGTFTLTTQSAFIYDSDTAVRDTYDSELIYDNSIVTFDNIFSREPNWSEGEFAIGVLRLNDDGKYEMKEKYILKYDKSSEIYVYNNSEYIYLKVNETVATNDRVDTYASTIDDLTINTDTSKDFADISYFTHAELYEQAKTYNDKEQYNVDYLLGYKAVIDGVFYSLDSFNKISNVRQNSIAINSIWDETPFFGLTSALTLDLCKNNFGIGNIEDYFKEFNQFSAFFNNMKLQWDQYNSEFIWLPLNGDIAGLRIENTLNSGVGVGVNIKNVIKLLFNLHEYNARKELNNKGLNVVQYDNSGNSIIFDSITMTKDLDSTFRELHIRDNMNKIKNDLRDILFSQLLKFVPDVNIFDTLVSNYLDGQKEGALKKYSISVEIQGDTVFIKLSLEFKSILRKISIEITIDENNINIIEK